ncbi:hypothetical protein D3C76_1504390 [compost metagenome]
MQQADRLEQAFGQVLPLGQRQRADLVIQSGQGRPGIFAHDVVQMLTLAGGMDFREMPTGHPLEKPLFRQQRLPGVMIVVQARGQGFQQPGLMLAITYPIEQRLLALAEYGFDLPALEHLARFQCRGQRPLL